MAIESNQRDKNLTPRNLLVYSMLKTSGPDGSTSTSAILKALYPTSSLNFCTKSIVFGLINRTNKKLKDEKIISVGNKHSGNSGHVLISKSKEAELKKEFRQSPILQP